MSQEQEGEHKRTYRRMKAIAKSLRDSLKTTLDPDVIFELTAHHAEKVKPTKKLKIVRSKHHESHIARAAERRAKKMWNSSNASRINVARLKKERNGK